MKLVKIGSSPSCDIVLNSECVSAHHADITVLDNGDIILEDKNSTNGTFVGAKKINSNHEVPIKRGDYVRFADTELVWGRVPQPDNNSQYKQVINIGSNYRNDVVLNSGTVSRYHAIIKIKKNGKAFIIDNDSKNGTQVNGVRVNGLTRIKRGDNILCGGEDITEQIKSLIPSAVPAWSWMLGGVAAVAAVIALIWTLPYIKGPGGDVFPEQVRPTVVYVRAAYVYELTIEDNPFTGEQKELLVKEIRNTDDEPFRYQATAFYIDNEGRMATNRHVALPWDEAYRDEGDTEQLRKIYKSWLLRALDITDFQLLLDAGKVAAITTLQQSPLGRAILDNCNSFEDVKVMLNIIRSSKVLISGKLVYITVGFPGKYYTHEDEFKRCYVLSESGDKEIDLAILQMNDKRTPDEIVNGKLPNGKEIKILNPMECVEENLVPLKENYTVIGYPLGLSWGLDEKSHALEPSVRSTQCAKEPSKYTFEFDSNSYGGSSGSPLFNKKGQLVGVLSSGYVGTTVTYAVHAKYLKKMYEDEVGK